MEGCLSGLRSTLGKCVYGQLYRGFESRPFRQRNMKKIGFKDYLCFAFLCLASVFLVALQQKAWGWLIFLAGLVSLLLAEKQFAKHVLLIYLALAILGITPISTDLSWGHFLLLSTSGTMVVALPFLISRYVYKDKNLITFKFKHGRNWFRSEIAYILVTAAVTFFLLPFYLQNTGAYLSWSVEPGSGNIIRLFIGLFGMGIWDELFFINTVLGILRRYLVFGWANLIQSILFTSFLYELGFTGWGFIMIFLFALSQGYIFKRSQSLFYVITIHLVLDFVLFLALIDAHHPTWLPIFITGN